MQANTSINATDRDCHTCPFEKEILEFLMRNNTSSLEPAMLRGQIPIAIIYIIIGSIGFILNCFVLMVHKRKQRSSLTTFRMLMMNLVVADTLSSAAVIMLGGKTIHIINNNFNGNTGTTIDANTNDFNQILIKNNVICKVGYVVFFLTSFVSTLTITGIAIMRCLYLLREGIHDVQNETLNKMQTILALFIIWGISIAGSVPVFRIVELTKGVKVRCFFADYGQGCDYSYNMKYILAISLTFCLIPLVILFISHACLGKFLLTRKKKRTKSFILSDISSDNIHTIEEREKMFQAIKEREKRFRSIAKKEKRAAIITNILTLIFIITTIPFIVYQWFFSVSKCNADELVYYWIMKNSSHWIFYEISHILFVLPPLLNPICYSLLNQGFRTECSSLFRIKSRNTSESSSSTRRTLLSNFFQRSQTK